MLRDVAYDEVMQLVAVVSGGIIFGRVSVLGGVDVPVMFMVCPDGNLRGYTQRVRKVCVRRMSAWYNCCSTDIRNDDTKPPLTGHERAGTTSGLMILILHYTTNNSPQSRAHSMPTDFQLPLQKPAPTTPHTQ